MYELTVAVDFDNCLIEPASNPLCGFRLKPNAKSTILKYSNLGVRFVLNTARYGRYYRVAVRFIKKNKLPISFKRSFAKIRADIYIDDRNIFCDEIDWQKIDEALGQMIQKEGRQNDKA